MDRLANIAARHAEDWVSLVWHAAWQGTVVGLAALAVVAVGRRWPAPVRYWILMLALIKFVTPPLTAFPTGVFSLVSASNPGVDGDGPGNRASMRKSMKPFSDNSVARASVAAESETPSEPRLPTGGAATAGNSDAPPDSLPTLTDAKAATGVSPAPRGWRLPAILMVAHLAGTGVILVVFIVRVFRLQDSWRWFLHPSPELADRTEQIARRLGLRRVPSVRLSRETQVPYSAGIFHPIVILPAGHARDFSPDDLHAVLCHELAHHRRGDLFINLLQVAIAAVWWFHPVVWLLNRTIRSIREECCDDLLLSQRFVNDESYCATLLHVAQTCSHSRFAAPVGVSIADGLHPLSNRIRRIMDESLPRRDRPGGLAALTLCVLAAVVLPGVRAVPAPVNDDNAAGQGRPATAPREADPEPVAAGRKEEPILRTVAPVFGRVTDATGQPIEGATVAVGQYFNNFDFPSITKTGEDGGYRFEHCPEGDSLLTIFKVGLAPHLRTVAVSANNGEFNAALQPGKTVRVRVTDRTGEPIGNARVFPFKWADTVTLIRLHNFGLTDERGLWTWDWAPDQELPYLISKDGYLDHKYAVLRPGKEQYDLQLLPELRVTVKVVDDATDRPIPAFRATLGLVNPKNSPPEQWQSAVEVRSADGAHTLHQGEIPWQECTVRVEADGYHPARSRNVRADEELVEVVVRLRAAERREAIVRDVDGTPAVGAAVRLGTETMAVDLLPVEATSERPGLIARTDRAGRFRFDARDGDFSIFVVARSGFGHASKQEIGGGAEEPTRILLKPWGRIEGTVRGGGKPLPNEQVTLQFELDRRRAAGTANTMNIVGGISSRSARTDRDGRFVFDRVPPGMDVLVGHLASVATPRGPMLGYRHAAYFQPAAGQVRTITLGGFGRTVIGRFQMKDEAWEVDWEASFGLCDPAARPGEVDLLYRPYPRFRIQKDGSFRLEEMPPGKYKIAFEVLALKPESSLKRKELPGMFIDTATVPELVEGDVDRPVDLGSLPVGFITRPPAE